MVGCEFLMLEIRISITILRLRKRKECFFWVEVKVLDVLTEVWRGILKLGWVDLDV